MKRNYIIIGLTLLLIGYLFARVSNFLIDSEIPDFINNKYTKIRSDKALMDSIGGYNEFEIHYNEVEFEQGDSLEYTIQIYGNNRVLVYKGFHKRDSLKGWELYYEHIQIH